MNPWKGFFMNVITKPVGPVMANCYLVINDDHHCLIVDPGEEASQIANVIDSLHVKVDGIVLTHAHFDHIGAVDELVNRFDVSVYVNEAEFSFFDDPMKNSSGVFMGMPELYLLAHPLALHEGHNQIGTFDVIAYHTPGHSIGSMILEIGNDLFTGDTLFQGSIGRTDLPTGSVPQMKKSLEWIKSLDKNYTIYPGHGPSTTLEIEKKRNPYLVYEML